MDQNRSLSHGRRVAELSSPSQSITTSGNHLSGNSIQIPAMHSRNTNRSRMNIRIDTLNIVALQPSDPPDGNLRIVDRLRRTQQAISQADDALLAAASQAAHPGLSCEGSLLENWSQGEGPPGSQADEGMGHTYHDTATVTGIRSVEEDPLSPVHLTVFNKILKTSASIRKKHRSLLKSLNLHARSPRARRTLDEINIQISMHRRQAGFFEQFRLAGHSVLDRDGLGTLMNRTFGDLKDARLQLSALEGTLNRLGKGARSPKPTKEDRPSISKALVVQAAKITATFRRLSSDCSKLSAFQVTEEPVPSQFALCQKVSSNLYQQLLRSCPKHPEHDVYFSLHVHGAVDSVPTLNFHLAFKRMTHDNLPTAFRRMPHVESPTYVWYRAQSTLLTLPAENVNALSPPLQHWRGREGIARSDVVAGHDNSRSNAPRGLQIPGRQNTSAWASACLANQLQGSSSAWAADLPVLMDTGDKVSNSTLYFPDKPLPTDCEPVCLSEWIRTVRQEYESSSRPIAKLVLDLMRIKVAHLLCEAVIKFTPDLWPRDQLRSSHIWLVADSPGHSMLEPQVSVMEPYLSVCLKSRTHGGPESSSAQAATTGAPEMASRALLLDLGIILYEMDFLELFPDELRLQQDENPGMANIVTGWMARLIPGGTQLDGTNGTSYANAARFCTESGRPSSYVNISDQELHSGFYQKVIVTMEKIERSISHLFDRARRANAF